MPNTFHSQDNFARTSGVVTTQKISRNPSLSGVPPKQLSLREIVRYGFPNQRESQAINVWRMLNFGNLWRGVRRVAIARAFQLPFLYGKLSLVVIRGNGQVLDYGLASLRVVTTAGANFIVDAFQNTVEVENLKFHGIGTGVAADAVGDTTLGTELTTQYNPDNTRATGTTTEGASANIYRTVGTNTLDSGTPAVTEHGVFSASAAGTLLDRSVFSAINLNGANGDGLQSTYDLTFSAGG